MNSHITSIITSGIVFIDPKIDDYETLIAGVTPDLDVVLLDDSCDGISQITQTLKGRRGLLSLHIVAHGEAGKLWLGNDFVNSNTLEEYKDDLRSWDASLAPDADILLYGCNVAAGKTGEQFVEKLAKLTGANIAASRNLKGSVILGGDWELEVKTGKIECAIAFFAETTEIYSAVFAINRVSIGTGDNQINKGSIKPSISASGRYVAFQSSASNLVNGDTNNTSDIFVYDRQTNTTNRVSVANNGTQGNGYSSDASVSGDGRYIAFQSNANNLTSGDTNKTTDIFLYDTQSNTTKRVSVGTEGTQANGESSEASISSDGRYVAFESSANNLISGDTNNTTDIFVYDTQSNTTKRVSVASDTPEQVQMIEHTLTVCRKVWNYALRERKDWLNSRKCQVNACSLESEYIIPADAPYPNYAQQCRTLTKAKAEFPELATVNAQALQQVLKRLEAAFVDMKRKGMGFPRFKNRYRMRSFVYPQLGSCQLLRGNQVKLPQLGWLEYVKSREIPDGFVVKQARIIRKASGYFVQLSLECDVSVPDVMPDFVSLRYHGHSVGIDLGLDKFVATSDGLVVDRPRFLNSLHSKLKLLQRRLRHKKKGSNNRHKLNRKIARLHQRISDTRKDWHFKLAHELCNGAGMIFVEDIDFRVWAKGMLGKHTLDAGFGKFVSILKWVCSKRDVYFAQVNKDYTSQVCPQCDTHTGKKELSVRIHSCPECGYTTHRDVAAAQIVRNRGLSGVGRILDIKENACGDGLTGTGNGLVKSPRSKKKGPEARLQSAS